VEIKCQLDATEVFIADLIACSICFGHQYAHHQELKSIIQCPKHVEQAIRSAIKPLVHLVGILFPHINEDARSKPHQKGVQNTAFCPNNGVKFKRTHDKF